MQTSVQTAPISLCLWNSAQILMEEFLSENVAKALLTVTPVDPLVVLAVLQSRFQQEFRGKKSLFQHSEGIMKIINVRKPSPAPCFWVFFFYSFHVGADVYIQYQDRRKVQCVALSAT